MIAGRIEWSLITCVLIAPGFIACARTSRSSTLRPTPAVALGARQDTVGLPGIAAEDFIARDTTLLRVVAQTIVDTFGRASPVRVDPQQLPQTLDAKNAHPGSVGAELNQQDQLANLSTAGLRLARLGDCGSAFANMADSTTSEHCPHREYLLVVFGAPRPGSPEGQPRNPAMPRIGLNPGAGSVRVVKSDVGPHGFSIALSDYVFERRGTRWVYVGTVGYVFID
jgi:hypothetical protein